MFFGELEGGGGEKKQSFLKLLPQNLVYFPLRLFIFIIYILHTFSGGWIIFKEGGEMTFQGNLIYTTAPRPPPHNKKTGKYCIVM